MEHRNQLIERAKVAEIALRRLAESLESVPDIIITEQESEVLRCVGEAWQNTVRCYGVRRQRVAMKEAGNGRDG